MAHCRPPEIRNNLISISSSMRRKRSELSQTQGEINKKAVVIGENEHALPRETLWGF